MIVIGAFPLLTVSSPFINDNIKRCSCMFGKRKKKQSSVNTVHQKENMVKVFDCGKAGPKSSRTYKFSSMLECSFQSDSKRASQAWASSSRALLLMSFSPSPWLSVHNYRKQNCCVFRGKNKKQRLSGASAGVPFLSPFSGPPTRWNQNTWATVAGIKAAVQ